MPASSAIPDLTFKLIHNGRYRLCNVMGTGSYGKVYRATDNKAPLSVKSNFCAIKCMKVADSVLRRNMQQSEITVHQKVNGHPSVVELRKTFTEHEMIYMVLSLCEGGTLTDLVRGNHFDGKDELLRGAFVQILDAVQHCHDQGVYHRDIKSDNVLCSKDKSRFYLADFGLATTYERSRQFGCGTRTHMSPENHRPEPGRQTYSAKAHDIWSMAVLIMYTINGRYPWTAARTTACHAYAKFVDNQRHLLTICPTISENLYSILTRMLHPDEMQRISAADARSAFLALDDFFYVLSSSSDSDSSDSGMSIPSDTTASSMSAIALAGVSAPRNQISDSNDSASAQVILAVRPMQPAADSWSSIPSLPVLIVNRVDSSESAGPITPPAAPVIPAQDVPDDLEKLDPAALLLEAQTSAIDMAMFLHAAAKRLWNHWLAQ